MTIVPALDSKQRTQVLELIDELGAWDRVESAKLGLDADLVASFYYTQPEGDPLAPFMPPDGCLLLALHEGELGGCIAYHRMAPDICEMKHLWVRPGMRGHGIARALSERLLVEAGRAGYHTMRLETGTFMTDAHKLYAAIGFARCAPYYTIPDEFLPFTLFMERELAPAQVRSI